MVEPWLVPIGYAESARLHGATFRTRTEVVGGELVCPVGEAGTAREGLGGLAWRLKTKASDSCSSGRSWGLVDTKEGAEARDEVVRGDGPRKINDALLVPRQSAHKGVTHSLSE